MEHLKSKIITLYTEGAIDGSHQLKGYDGNCSQVHGHSWWLRIWIKGNMDQLDTDGILFDFKNVKQVVDLFDHKFINDIEPFNVINPTAENLTNYIYTYLLEIYPELQFRVRLYETAVLKNTYAEMGDF